MSAIPVDDHFRAAIVPSRTADPEPVLLWDGRPAPFPLSARLGEGSPAPEAVVLDADGRELRRFPAPGDPAEASADPLGFANALVERLEALRTTGEGSASRSQAAPPADARAARLARIEANAVPVRRALATILFIAIMVAGLGVGAALFFAGSEPDKPGPVAGESGSAAQVLQNELIRLRDAQQVHALKTGRYAADLAQAGYAPPEGVEVAISQASETGYSANAAMRDPPARCTLTVQAGTEPRIDCD